MRDFASTVRTRRPDSPEHLLDDLVCARESGSERRIAAAEQAILVEYLNVAGSIAACHRGRGADVEDLVQVARLGLLKAVRGWRPQPTGGFLSYAIPMMNGEVQRHIRDRSSLIRVPRRIHELRPLLMDARRTLESNGEDCTPEALAHEAGVSVAEVREHLDAHVRSHPLSSDGLEDFHDRSDLACGVSERARELVEDRVGLRAAIKGLSERQRKLLALRFFEDRNQQEIANEVGVSQMQISRLLTQIFATLRAAIGETRPAS